MLFFFIFSKAVSQIDQPPEVIVLPPRSQAPLIGSLIGVAVLLIILFSIVLYFVAKKRKSNLQIEELRKGLKEYAIPYTDLQLKEEIGSGAFGAVHRAEWNHSAVVVKKMKFSESDHLGFLEEAKKMA